jgi:hypothetical protein
LLGGINLYGYVGGNPINSVDFRGLAGEEVIVGGGFAGESGVGTAIVEGAATGGAIVAGAGAIVLATPSETSICSQLYPMPEQEDQWNDECKSGKCKPCTPPVGTIATEVHLVPPSKPHYPIEYSHIHWFKMHQSPYPTCKCFWKRNFQPPTPGNTTPPGTIPVTPAAGGGPM